MDSDSASSSAPSSHSSVRSDSPVLPALATNDSVISQTKAADAEPVLENGEDEGLIVERTQSSLSQSGVEMDVVIVHGLYGFGGDRARSSPGSGTSRWVDQYIESSHSDSRVLLFKYKPRRMLAGFQSRKAIRKCAVRLLHDFVKLRERESTKRSIMFVAHDIGGIIVKDALAAAALSSTASWGDILDYTRILVFSGCPHRSIDKLDMEGKLSHFLFAEHDSSTTELCPTVSLIPGLATAITEINGLFIESKTYIRSYLISVHANTSLPGNINQAFDNYTSTLGLPFERRIEEPQETGIEERHREISEHLNDLEAYLKALDVDLVRNERTLISLSSPINPFKTAGHAHDPVIKLDTFQKWLNSTGPPILYVYGTDAVQEASEQIFYAIDDRMRTVPHSPYLIFYFSFDRWDSRRNSINAMLSTFLAQNICHHTSSMSQWVEILFEQLNEEHGWTDLDTINWFEIFRIRGHTHNVSLVINYFDECDEASRNTFLAFVKRRFSGCEITWKIVITSRKPGAFADELSDWPSIDLANIESGVMQQRSRNVENDIARLIKFRPDVAPLEDLLRKELVPLVDIDPLARHIVCEQARLQKDWPEETSLQKVFCLVDRPSDDHWSLESILDRVLRRIPEQYQVKKLLAWLLYGIRQLTIWELASVMFLGSDQDQGEAYPGPSTIQDLILRCETWLAGIVEIQHNEIRIQHSRLRDIFMTPGTATGQLYLWHEVQEFANFEITKTCLEFLSRTSVQGVMEQMYQSPGSDLIEVSNFPDRENLCSYAVRAWPQHYLLIPDGLNPSKLLDKFLRSAVMTTWPKAYWALSNPVTRPSQCLETLYPTFVGLGLSSYSLKPQNDEDLASALVEAARNGWVNALTDLLHQTAYSKTALMDALVAAAAGGVQQIMLDIIDQIVANNKHDTVQLEWPPVLLYRAGWLDLDKFAERLLELGCAPEPGDPKARKSLSTPLFQAVRFGHLSTVRVLLKYKADVRFRTIWERQPLQWSIYFGHAHVAKALVEEGHAELEATDDEGFTALYHAARLGYYPAVEALLQLGADPQMGKTAKTSHPGWLPLVTAASLGHRKSVLALLERGANPNMKGPWGYGTPLRYAAVNSEREISSLLLEYGADPNSPLIQPPLLIDVVIDSTLSMSEKAGMLALLIENKALVDASDPRGMTALMHAVRRGDELLVKCLLEHDADVDLCNEDGEAPLHFAAQKDREDIIKLLLQKDPDVNCRNQARRGYTPLILGCGNEKIVRLLLEKGADPEVPSNEGVTPLMFAASNGHSDAAKLLLEHKATVDSEVDRDKARSPGWTAASFAAKLGHGHILRLLANAGADLNHETKEGVRPIHLAAATDSLHPLLEFRKRFDIDQAEPENGDTALHYVVKKSAPIKNVKCLVNSGANLNVQNKNGDTPLTLAANYGKQEVVSIFLAEKDLDINLASPCHGGAVHQACQMSHIDIVKLLVEHGADVNYAVPGMPGTPLQAACLEYPYTIGKQLVKFLIASGADVKKQGGLLGCALSAAALMNSTELVRLFLDEGAMTDTCDGMGRVPIHFSAERGIDTFKIILDAGGDIRARDKIHRTALHWAAQHARLQVVELLLPALGSEAVDETDIDGWTPLCWAARGPEGWLSRDVAEGRADQVKIIRLLLKHGADRFTQGTIGEQKWSPLKIARYSDANAETLKLLERGLGDGSDDSKNAQATSENDSDDMTKPGLAKAFTCDYCMWEIRGFVYRCETCLNFGFCNKCYTRRGIIHVDHPDHTFEEVGLEFDDGSGSPPTGDYFDSQSEKSDSYDAYSSDSD